MQRSVNGEMSMFTESALSNFMFQFMLSLPLQVVSIVSVLFKEMKQKVLVYIFALCLFSNCSNLQSHSSDETGGWEELFFSFFFFFPLSSRILCFTGLQD